MSDQIREALKSILTSDMTGGSKGGLMLAEQVEEFLDLTLEYSTLGPIVRTMRKLNKQGEIDTLNVGAVVSEGADEGPVDGIATEEVKATFGKIEYTMKKVRSMFDISTESLLDNVEAEKRFVTQHAGLQGDTATSFQEKLMRAYAKRIATDLELQAIQGDASIVTSVTKLDRLLKANDGWDVLTATGCHYVDANYTNISEDLLAAMLESMPAPYLKRLPDLRWFVGPRAKIRWDRKVAARATNLGDAVLKGADTAPFGIPMIRVPLIPEDQLIDDGTTDQDTLSFIWLTFPENFIWTFRRQIESYWEFNPRRDKWENTTYSEQDVTLENKDAIVKAINLKVDASTAYTM